MGLWWPNHQ